jgi:hypothetical protein
LKNKREALEDALSSINRSIAESEVWLLTLETFHREHVKETKPKENA